MNHNATTDISTRPNRLAREKSPYLLQHQFNPVDWHPWGEDAFAQARKENKVIFLSIGYSTCHWCHVMERESFENPDIADYLNQHFVSIKVDREERPDVDGIYLNAVQAMTGQGGWPLSVFLTPELKPFYGGTYFPLRSQPGRPGIGEVLRHIQKLWHHRRNDLEKTASDLTEHLKHRAVVQDHDGILLTEDSLRRGWRRLRNAFDHEHGGFGTAPKFPHPSQPSLLLRGGVRFKDDEAMGMALFMCDRMAAGGIRDHLGGGFARYSVDAEWLVPHFEKMLYDNAQLVQLYLDAFLVSGHTRYADVVREILAYVQRDMTHPEGGFYSAEDADSEGKEGKFYCWTQAELSRLLTQEEFRVAIYYFGMTEAGNFKDHSDPQALAGQNVLHIATLDLPTQDQAILASARRKMLAARSHRVRPHRDDKVLSSWNGLMLGAFARAGAVLNEPDYQMAAERNLGFIQTRLWDRVSATLYHRWREGVHDVVQLLSAYAFLLHGVIDLYESTLRPEHLVFATTLADSLILRFHDPQDGGFWTTSAEAQDVILRLKEDYDGAEPAANSVAIFSLLRLSAITGRTDFRDVAEQGLRARAVQLEHYPQALCFLMHALDLWLQEPSRIVIAGSWEAPETQSLLYAAHQVYVPNKVVLGNTGRGEPVADSLIPNPQKPTAYVCIGTSCQPPVYDPQALKQLLDNSRRSHA
jgi:uncharacterized protein YyaL (SSP411 family)